MMKTRTTLDQVIADSEGSVVRREVVVVVDNPRAAIVPGIQPTIKMHSRYPIQRDDGHWQEIRSEGTNKGFSSKRVYWT